MRNAVASVLVAAWMACGPARADTPRAVPPPAALLAQAGQAPAAGTTDLKFRDFFVLPVGPRGLVPSERLRSLADRRVRIVGYMARQEGSGAGALIVAPLPVTLGDEDERYADDLPATALYVHLAEADRGQDVPWMPGLLSFTGVLRLGAASEADGRMSFVRLELDPALSRAIAAAR